MGPFYKLMMTEVSINLRNCFCQNTLDFGILSWIFLHLKKFLKFFSVYRESPFCKLIMTEISRNLLNIFFPKISPILKIYFPKYGKHFFHLKFISKKKKKIKSE